MACNKNGTTEPKEIMGLNHITKKRLLELCKKNKLYQTPSLNDVLYLHYQGFQSIECLEEYSELKCLWLECNAISEIQGLDNQTKLKCLFLQSNLIKKMENLDYCKELDTINLSQNHIRKIENCGYDVLPVLNTLNISSNYIKDCDGLKELENCRTLSVLDLSNNRIDDILVVKIFSKMPELKVLVLQGNPVVSKIPQYRKTLILECKKLTYLDSRPVFPKDRACAEAWKRGGYKEERLENDRWNRKERKKMRDSVNATIRMRNKTRKHEDQLTLLGSSDSEDASDTTKYTKQDDNDALDSIWDEVAEDSKSDTASSDINISSSTSAISITDSNGQDISSYGKTNESIRTIDAQNIHDHLLEKEKNYILAESKSVHSDKDTNERINSKQIEEYCKNIEEVKDQGNETAKRDDAINKIKGEQTKRESILRAYHGYDFELDKQLVDDNDFTGKEPRSSSPILNTDNFVEDQCKNMCTIAFNSLSEIENTSPTPIKRVQLQIESHNANEEEDNYEPFKELEEVMNTLINKKEDLESEAALQENSLSSNPNMLTTKVSKELQYEKECTEVNHQLKKDFEQLSTNMEIFMIQLNNDKIERKEAMDDLLDKKSTTNESTSGSSGNEAEDIIGKAVNFCAETCTNSQQENNIIQHEIKDIRFETLENRFLQNAPAIFSPNFLTDDKMKALAEYTLKSTMYNDCTPMDITLLPRYSVDTLNSFEKYANELKEPLEKIENKTEDLIKEINTETNCYAENNKNDFQEEKLEKEFKEGSKKPIQDKGDEKITEIFKEDSEVILHEKIRDKCIESSTEIEITKLQGITGKHLDEHLASTKSSVSEPLLDEIIQSLELKPKNYEFEIESDEEFSYSEVKIERENLPTSTDIPGFVEPFNQFLKNISSRNHAEMRREPLERPLVLYEERKRVPIIHNQKSISLHELTKQPNRKDFNNDKDKSLDTQLEQFKKEQTKRIRCLVDRVYSQRDRYNDTLEVIDGKLMVRNKDTEEVKELPTPLGHSSDSGSEYDTAQSDEEKEGATCSKPRECFEDDQYQDQSAFSSKQIKGLRDHQREIGKGNNDNESERERDDSSDEFYSLDPQAKPNIYGSIDEEFFNTLTFDQLNLSEKDENHIIQCARSYEDLKKYLKLGKEESCLTENEKELFKIMTEKKPIKLHETPDNNLQTLSNSNAFTKAQDLLLKKCIQRTKDTDRFEMNDGESNRDLFGVDNERMAFSKAYLPQETPYEIGSTTESIVDYSTDAYGNDLHSFVFEEPDEENKIKEEKEQPEDAKFLEHNLQIKSSMEHAKQISSNIIVNTNSDKAFILQKLPDYNNTTDISNEAICREQHSNLQEYQNISMGTESKSRSNKHMPDLPTFSNSHNHKELSLQKNVAIKNLTSTSSEQRNLEEFPLHGNSYCHYRPPINPPNSEVTNQQVTDKLPSYDYTDYIPQNTTKNSQSSSIELENYKEFSLQVNGSNFQEPTQNNANNSDVSPTQPMNNLPPSGYTLQLPSPDYVDNSQKVSENLDSTSTPDIEVLECNLEIFGCNDEIIDAITVNAELHYDY